MLAKNEEPVNQMDLFTLVDLPVASEVGLARYSNAIGDIDIIPRFIRGKNPNILLKDAPDITEVSNPYMVNKVKLMCNIKPAQIQKKIEGKLVTVLAYPGDREELIESVLFMIASNGKMKKRAVPGVAPRHGVEFSLYEIREHLRALNKLKPYDEIREALLVLRDSGVTITQEDGNRKVQVTNKIFADSLLETTGSGRGKDRAFVTFSDYVIEQIQKLNYRQYAFSEVNGHKKSVARYIHAFLCWNWLNAAKDASFDIDPQVIINGYGKQGLSLGRVCRDVREGLSGLVVSGHITHLPRLSEGKYKIVATLKLANEIKQSNSKKRGIMKIQEKLESGVINKIPEQNDFNDFYRP